MNFAVIVVYLLLVSNLLAMCMICCTCMYKTTCGPQCEIRGKASVFVRNYAGIYC